MRICHVTFSLDPARGGVPAVAARLAAAQASLGHDVTLIATATPAAEANIAASLSRVPFIDRVRVVQVPTHGRLSSITGSYALGALRDAAGSTDVFHLHGLWEPIVLRASMVARAAGKPYVLTPHGMLDPWSLAQKRLKKRLFLAIAYRRMLNRAAWLHVLNEDERKLIEPLGLRAPTHVFPNGVFLEEIEPLPPAGAFRAAHPELGSDPYVLFLSRLHHKKGLDILASAFAEVVKSAPNARLVVAGPDEGARDDFVSRITEAGVSDRVHLVGPLYGRTKYEAMVDAACFCLPSRQEGFSIAILEALACGLPVVISEACHFPEVVEAGGGWVVSNPLDWGYALGHLIRDRAARAGDAAKRMASRYTWPSVAERIVTDYPQNRLEANA